MQARQGDVPARLPHHCVLIGLLACLLSCAREAPDENLFAGGNDVGGVIGDGENAQDSGFSQADGGPKDSAADASTTRGDKDTVLTDTGFTDTAPTDTGLTDTLLTDTGTADTTSLDTDAIDAGSLDTGLLDTGPIDTGPGDTGVPVDAGCKGAGDCDDNNLCTTDLCNPTNGTCSHKPHTGRPTRCSLSATIASSRAGRRLRARRRTAGCTG